MKEGWEYKKLGEVCETSSGGTPSKNNKEYYEDGNIPWLRSGEVAQGLIYKSELFITEKGLNNSSAKLFPIDTIVLAMYGATVGQVGLLKKEMATNQAICGIFPNKRFIPMFLLYSLRAKKPFFMKDAVGGAQPNISQNLIKNTFIPVPPLSEQQRIVEELDLLNSIIEKKKAQLKELDSLAQSIFYDMFGDPTKATNGWKVKKMGDVCTLKSGNSDANKSVSGDLPYVKVGDMNIEGNETFITLSSTYVDREANAKNIFPIGTTIFPKRGGAILTNKKRLTKKDICCDLNVMGAIPNTNMLHPLYLFYYFLRIDFCIFANTGSTIPQINNYDIAPMDIAIPPLPLQQQFAEKVEAIEHQKELIKQSIKEVETLFNSRMDYYFN